MQEYYIGIEESNTVVSRANYSILLVVISDANYRRPLYTIKLLNAKPSSRAIKVLIYYLSTDTPYLLIVIL